MRRRRYYPLEHLFGRVLTPFEQFLRRTTAGGIILMAGAVLALIVANTPVGEEYRSIWELKARVGIGSLQLEMTLHQWVNDGLMTLFFFLVGLELKREMLVGELSSIRDATLPVVAAVGGMVVPAIIYNALNYGGPASRGWGIPMATDIAFAVGILVLLSWRIPRNLIVFLTALAIADDLGAVLIIALFYTQEINVLAIEAAGAIFILLLLLNEGGIRRPLPYVVLGVLLWLALHHSGVHPTIGGVLLAFAIPARPTFTPFEFEQRMVQLQRGFHAETEDERSGDLPLSNPRMATIAGCLERAAEHVQAPLQRLEHSLSPWVTFVIIPLFAFSNVGIDFGEVHLRESLTRPVTFGVTFGLVFGKFLGISGFSWLAVKTGIGRLPAGVQWRHLLGVAWLAGIGFTMSLFISNLAFMDPVMVEEAKIGILLASLISGILGLTWLYLAKGELQVQGARLSDLLTDPCSIE